MKKTFLTLIIITISFCSYAQYLPLTAGSSTPLTGDLYIDGTNGNRLIFSYGGVSNNKVLLGSTYSIFGAGSKDDFATYIRDNNPYSVWTNNLQRMTIDGSGKVGIGTTTPTAGLDIADVTGGTYNFRVTGGYTNFNSTTSRYTYGTSGHLWDVTYGDITTFSFNDGTAWSTNRVMFDKFGNIGITGGLTASGTGPSYFSGNVGIGTTTPADKFHVLGTSDHQLAIDASGQYSTLDFMNAQAIKTQLYWDNAFSNFNIQSASSLLLQPGGANVGIGAENPVSLFQVDDGCTKASIGDASGALLNYGTSYLGFNASRNGANNWLTNTDSNNNGGGVIYSSIFGDMYFAIIPTTGSSGQTLTDANLTGKIAMRIDHTDGTVYAKEVSVQTTVWPDFVFKNNYKLMPLSELKTYVDKNQHLPEVPSAAEVTKDGQNLGEMNKLLLKKVEELTLYLIEKDKQMKAIMEHEQEQDKINQKLSDQLKTIRAQLIQQK